MRVTVVAFFFPPVNQVGYKRPLRLIDWMQKQGHAVTVYAVSPATPQLWNWTGVDLDLINLIPSGVKVVRTPSIHLIKGLLGLRDRLKGRGRGVHGVKVEVKRSTPALGSATDTAPPSHRGMAAAFIDSVQSWFEVPDPYLGWIITTLPGLLLRSILLRPKFIYVTGPPWSPLLGL
jgi:hypothetical protein